MADPQRNDPSKHIPVDITVPQGADVNGDLWWFHEEPTELPPVFVYRQLLATAIYLQDDIYKSDINLLIQLSERKLLFLLQFHSSFQLQLRDIRAANK